MDSSIQLALVFGSIAREDGRVDSDLDLAVLADQRPLSAAQRQALIADVAARTGRPVDLVDLRTAGVPLRRAVFREGQVISCRDPRAYEQALTRLLTDCEDFLPYRERMLRERRQAWIGSS